MIEISSSILAGFIIGAIFTMIKLPIPAPPVLSGCMAVVGVWAGHHAILQAMERFFS